MIENNQNGQQKRNAEKEEASGKRCKDDCAVYQTNCQEMLLLSFHSLRIGIRPVYEYISTSWSVRASQPVPY